MPIYSYRCRNGHTFDELVRNKGDEPKSCPQPPLDRSACAEDETCGAPVEKVMTSPASIFPGAASWR